MSTTAKPMVVPASELEPGMAFGRRQVVDHVEDKGDGTVLVHYTNGRSEVKAAGLRCFVHVPAPDWQAIATQWRDLALELVALSVDPPSAGALCTTLLDTWPS